MGRVDIAGQFNVDAALCSRSSGRFEIERHPPTVSTATIRDWNGFCDSVDQAVAPLAKIRMVAKVSSFLLYVFIAFWVVGLQIFPRIMDDFDFGLLKYSAFVIFPLFALYFLVWFTYVRGGLHRGMDKVKEVCETYTARNSGVKYTLESEHWGNCAKPHVKRWYIKVEIDEEANASGGAVQQIETAGVAASDYFSNQAPAPDYFSTTAQNETAPAVAVAVGAPHHSTSWETGSLTADATPTTRLEDMLK